MYQRLVCLLVLALLMPCGTRRAQAQTQQTPPPNVVLILADDLGYGDVSYMGHAEDIQTPSIDALAGRGVTFDRFYANCPVCSPTRAAMLAGRYQELVGVPGVIRQLPEMNWGYLLPSAVLLPARLKEAGYHSALIGKWHLGYEPPNTPNARGFDLFHGFLGDMMDDYNTHLRGGENWMRHNNETIDPPGHATDLFSQWAADYIEDRADHDAPFFLFLSYNAPHVPIQPPAAWVDRVKQRQPGITDQRAQLVALIEHMDQGIGQVVEALKETDQIDNTLIIFTSDNGGQLHVGANCGPLRGGKGALYEGGVRVPMLAVWPGVIAPGSTASAQAMTMDLFTTICDAAGVEPGEHVDGVSLMPLLSGELADNAWPQRDLFWIRREGWSYMGQEVRAMRRGPWKLVQNSPFDPYELFNLDDDPLEENDLSQERREVFGEMSADLQLHMQRSGSVPWQKPDQ